MSEINTAAIGGAFGPVEKAAKRIYDSIGRVERDSVFVGSSEHIYSRYEYPTNGVQSKAYSTLVGTNSNGPDAADEGLRRAGRTEHEGRDSRVFRILFRP